MLSLYLTLASALAGSALGLQHEQTVLVPNNRKLTLSHPFDGSSCPSDGPASCQDSSSQGSCCLEAPGGLITLIQFWDTKPSTGPSDSWTIHGLWPNNCDGTYNENCDPGRAYRDIGEILENAGEGQLKDFLDQYMLSNDETPERFWEHEWSQHGTCYTTLSPQCISAGGNAPEGQDAVYFFHTLANLFQQYPTYKWLAAQDIHPGNERTYTYDEFTGALKTQTGTLPAIFCHGAYIYQIYWYFNLVGSVIDGNFVPIDAPVPGNCHSSGLRYVPKTGGRHVE